MARSVPISLPNGRNWARKGDAVDHFKSMLARYTVGDRIDDAADHDDLAALLRVYDSVLGPGAPTQTGSGVAYFEKNLDMDHPGNTACFFVIRTDATRIDFSTRRALDVAGARSR